jgi:DNA-binding transcriptional regulator PaaX
MRLSSREKLIIHKAIRNGIDFRHSSNTRLILRALYVFTSRSGSLLVARHGINEAISIRDKQEYASEYRTYKRAVIRAKKRNLIKVEKRANKARIALTDEGMNLGIKSLLEMERRLLPKGEKCLVTFDIPEHVRDVRQSLRRLLKSSRFVQVQRSVWSSKRDVIEILRIYLRKAGLNEWVDVYHVVG